MRIIHGGVTETFSMSEWAAAWAGASSEKQAAMRIRASEGLISDDDGVVLTGRMLQRVRDRLLGTYAAMPEPLPLGHGGRNGEPKRWLVQDVWAFGTMPMVGGNPKAGKTTLIIDLTAALITPGRRFLDRFEVPDLAEAEADIYLINVETLAADFEAELEAQGVVVGAHVVVDHLETLGGPQILDLTDPDIYDWWAHRLAFCQECEGRDDTTPFIVMVDGLTAILNTAGKGTDWYGKWYAAFRRLMREVDVPSALVTGHNTLAGGHLMGGVEAQAGADGLWTYSSDNPDNPTSTRRFGVVPRLGGVAIPPMRVDLVEGRLVAEPTGAAARGGAPKKTRAEEVEAVALRTAAYVAEHPGAHGQELTDNIEAGSKALNLEGRALALDRGLVREEKCLTDCNLCDKPYYRRLHYWPADAPG
ncbi:hypothetical protein ASE25_07825 [Terrabacter sp. Root85]|uniref:AAA family ATPase n=1 Tax=Terrabacter sp. Root85 TaxID=1736603 RepID=UPI0006F2B83A|nr:AAA family ATPase [Terrabacter sp. Root85]KRC89496.1 hypothetical protein ASE25_07825 [Terrabacter sp. Root85]